MEILSTSLSDGVDCAGSRRPRRLCPLAACAGGRLRPLYASLPASPRSSALHRRRHAHGAPGLPAARAARTTSSARDCLQPARYRLNLSVAEKPHPARRAREQCRRRIRARPARDLRSSPIVRPASCWRRAVAPAAVFYASHRRALRRDRRPAGRPGARRQPRRPSRSGSPCLATSPARLPSDPAAP